MVSDYALRDDLIAKVRAGAMTPSEAEVEAARLGLEAFEYRPDPHDFDPMQEQFWTLPMAVAWISCRTVAAVREHWDDYRFKCRHWLNIGQTGMFGISGFEVFYFGLTNLRLMQALEEQKQSTDRDYAMSVAQAKHALWHALRNSALTASGIEIATEKRELIDALRLQDLTLDVLDHRDVLRTRAPIGIGPVRYKNITVPMATILDCWGSDRAAIYSPTLAKSRSGAPGRPSSMHLVEAEFRRRCEDGTVKERISHEAEFLHLWLKATHPQEPTATPKTIGHRIRAAFRAHLSARK